MPELNNASSLTYSTAAASTAASSRYASTDLARAAAVVSVPSQIALVGKVSDRFRLAQPITVNFEHEDGGKIIVSDDIFYMYGEGVTRQDALLDYVISLAEYYEVLESQEDAPSTELFLYLQSYLQPISR